MVRRAWMGASFQLSQDWDIKVQKRVLRRETFWILAQHLNYIMVPYFFLSSQGFPILGAISYGLMAPIFFYLIEWELGS